MHCIYPWNNTRFRKPLAQLKRVLQKTMATFDSGFCHVVYFYICAASIAWPKTSFQLLQSFNHETQLDKMTTAAWCQKKLCDKSCNFTPLLLIQTLILSPNFGFGCAWYKAEQMFTTQLSRELSLKLKTSLNEKYLPQTRSSTFYVIKKYR